ITPPPSIRGNEATIGFYQSLLTRLRALPGVEAATLMGNRIGSGWSNNTVAVVDGASPAAAGPTPMRWNSVGPDYFRALGTPILLGRDFRDADLQSSSPVAIVNETFTKRYLAGRPALGHRVALSTDPSSRQFEIVGVAADSLLPLLTGPRRLGHARRAAHGRGSGGARAARPPCGAGNRPRPAAPQPDDAAAAVQPHVRQR